MPTHDPARKRKGFSVRRKVRIHPNYAAATLQREEQAAETLLGRVPAKPRVAVGKKLKQMVPLLWSSNYQQWVDMEADELMSMGVLEAALNTKAAAPLSTYAERGLTKDKEKRATVVMKQSADIAAAAVRQANQQQYPFTVCARSVSMLTHLTRDKDWKEAVKDRRVLDKKTSTKLVRLMMAAKPPPPSEPMLGFSLHIYDQCYKKKGQSRGKHRAAEKVDASGDLVDLVSMVVVNSLTVHVPRLLAGGLSAAKRASLRQTGPYTKPFVSSLLPALHPDAVIASLYSLKQETNDWIIQVMTRSGTQQTTDLNVALVARALIGRPNVDGGKTPMTINDPLLNCDTRARKDTVRISTYLENRSNDGDVIGCMSDGQSMVEQARLIRQDPIRWKMLLIMCGCFHQFGHFMFGQQEAYFEAITACEHAQPHPGFLNLSKPFCVSVLSADFVLALHACPWQISAACSTRRRFQN